MTRSRSKIQFDDLVRPAIAGLKGQNCCRQRVGRSRSLSLGFGGRILHGDSRLVDNYYGEWEVGSYTAAWRVIKGGKIVCGSQDVVDSLSELDERLRAIELGYVKDVEFVSSFLIRLKLSNQISVEFLAASSDDDELFHIFCPEDLCAEYSVSEGWRVLRARR